MRIGRLTATVGLLAALGGPGSAAGETQFVADSEVGNNAFTAVFDSAIGERITAVSSAVGCTVTVDEAKLEGHARCSVPLGSIRVDNDDPRPGTSDNGPPTRRWSRRNAPSTWRCRA